MILSYAVNILRLSKAMWSNIVVTQVTERATMNIYNIVYHGIRIISLILIMGILNIGFILPISFVQALVINPIILVFLMIIFAVSNEKIKSVKKLADVISLPSQSKCRACILSKAA